MCGLATQNGDSGLVPSYQPRFGGTLAFMQHSFPVVASD
jgi:hypothetical protein